MNKIRPVCHLSDFSSAFFSSRWGRNNIPHVVPSSVLSLVYSDCLLYKFFIPEFLPEKGRYFLLAVDADPAGSIKYSIKKHDSPPFIFLIDPHAFGFSLVSNAFDYRSIQQFLPGVRADIRLIADAWASPSDGWSRINFHGKKTHLHRLLGQES